MKNINHALEIGPDSPQGWIEKGNALFYMPKMFGGSKEKALESYNKAIQLMEKEPEMISRNWMYINVLMILGQSYEETDNLQLAKTTYEKILKIEPGFTYMRDEIYPSFQKKWESQN
jgi:tetratricopeptide (TPR) repeat protein